MDHVDPAHPPLERLTAVLEREGLPPATGIRWLRESGPLVVHQLSFPTSQVDLLLYRLTWNPGYDPFQNELAAITSLQDGEVPCLSDYRILPFGALPEPAALSMVPTGVPGDQIIRARPQLAPAVVQTIGQVVARLVDHPVLGFGTRGDAGLFAPVRSTWNEEWRAVAEAELLGAHAAGVGGLPICGQLWSRVEEGLAALGDEPTPCLLHRNLHPKNLLFVERDQRIALNAVVGWSNAAAGDPVAEWTALLHQPPALLRGVVAGCGTELVEEMLETDAVDRLDLYVAIMALAVLRSAGQGMLHRPSPRAARKLAKALGLCEVSATPGLARARLEEALSDTPPAPRPPTRGVDPLTGLVRLAAHALGTTPPLIYDQLPHVISALAAAELASVTEGDTAQHFLTVGHQFMTTANLKQSVLHAGAVRDRQAWRESLVKRIASGCAPGGPALGAAALSWGLDALGVLGDQLPDQCLRGLEALVSTALAREASRRSGGFLSPRARIVHGIIGQDAALRLGLPELAQTWAEQVEDGLDVLEINKNPDDTRRPIEMEALLPMLARPILYVGDNKLFLPFAAAVNRLSVREVLPDRPEAIVNTCFAPG